MEKPLNIPTAQTLPALALLIEDEAPMRRFLRTYLAEAGYRTQEASSGQEGLKMAAENPPDIVLLDLGLPDLDGQHVLLKLREWLKAPIIILSVRDQDAQKIAALDHGADDYLTKPFSTGELLARIRAAMRNTPRGPQVVNKSVFEYGDLKVDLDTRRVFLQGAEVHLTRIEYKLLTTLLEHAGKVLTHQYLLKKVWGTKQLENTQHLRVFMAGLRRKIEIDPTQPRHLLTEQGVGYRLASD